MNSEKYHVSQRQLIVKESGISWKDIDGMDIFQYYMVVDNTFATIEERNKILNKN